jgi:hypothetical protein
MLLYGTEWRERDYGLWGGKTWTEVGVLDELYLTKPAQRGSHTGPARLHRMGGHGSSLYRLAGLYGVLRWAGLADYKVRLKVSPQVISDAGRSKPDFAERNKCKPVLLRLSLARNLEKLLMSLYGTEWRGEHDKGLWGGKTWTEVGDLDEPYLAKPAQQGSHTGPARLHRMDMVLLWRAICSYCVSRLGRHVTYYSPHMLYICRYSP